MKIFYDSDLISDLNNSYLFLDTTAFITAFSYQQEFGKLLEEIKDQGCAFLTIPSVVFEFTRGSDSLETYNTRASFVEDLATIYPIEKNLAEQQGMTVVLQKVGNQMSYTDFLLGICLSKFSDAYLLTENHKDFPHSIFDRVHTITIDNGKEIHNHGIYKLNLSAAEKAAARIIEDKNSA